MKAPARLLHFAGVMPGRGRHVAAFTATLIHEMQCSAVAATPLSRAPPPDDDARVLRASCREARKRWTAFMPPASLGGYAG